MTTASLPSQSHAATPAAEHTFEVEVTGPLAVPDSFIDYAAEGEEPADLALTALIPIGLAEFNLSNRQSGHQQSSQQFMSTIDGSRSLAATSQPSENMLADILDDDIADLIPDNLVSLNLKPKSPIVISQQPLPNLSTLARTGSVSKTDSQSSAEPTEDATIRIPAAHLIQLNSIIADLLQQQTRQTRHNEQLGALVKQLLRQLAQSQLRKNHSEQETYSNIQKLVTDCLSGKSVTESSV
ncbi:MAG: hypothetical protein AAFU53_04755 [Cyanobacteria bacterium J06632_3]